MATFTNFCCRSGGSNLNAGTRTGDTTEPGTGPFKSYVSGTWVQATRTFTPAGGANPVTDGIAVGDFVSIFPDAATVSPYVARITTVTATTIITSATAKSGTAPVDGATNTTANIGGAWKGPNAAEGFPFNFVAVAMTNVAGNPPRINFKNDATYSITAAMTQSVSGVMTWQGYNASYGDGGKAIIDGGTSGASYILLTISANTTETNDFIFQNNGATGNANGVVVSGARNGIRRCVFNSFLGFGLSCTTSPVITDELEFYLCNGSNTVSFGAMNGGTSVYANRCIFHDNAGSNGNGLVIAQNQANVSNCIFDTNGGNGILVTASGLIVIENCDFYSQTSSGINLASGVIQEITIENSNFLKNTVDGILIVTAASCLGTIRNCGFGTGTQANGTDIVGDANIIESNNISYASGLTPWAAPDTGNFKITLAAAINAGRGAFTETQASYTGTVGFPVIGAAQAVVSAVLSAGLAALRLIGVGRW